MSDTNIPFYSYAEPSTGKSSSMDDLLIVLWSRDAIHIAIKDNNKGSFKVLEGYRIETHNIIEGTERIPSPIVNYAKSCAKSIIIACSPYTCLLPKPVFRKDDARKFLSFNHMLPDDALVFENELSGNDIIKLFALEKKSVDILNRCFNFPDFIHSATVLINGILHTYKNHLSDHQLFANITGQRLELVHFREKQLAYYNQFEFKSKEDYIYYLLFAAEQLGLNPESFDLIIGGETDTDSSLVILSEKYIRNVSFMERSKAINLGPMLGQIPHHQHWLILNGGICES